MKKIFLVAFVIVIVLGGCSSKDSNQTSSKSETSTSKSLKTPFETAMENYTKKTYYGMLLDTEDSGRVRLAELVKCWTRVVEPLMDEKTKQTFISDANNKDSKKDLEYDYGLDSQEINEAQNSCTKDLDEQL